MPFLTVLGIVVGTSVGATIVIEEVFNYPGFGQLFIQAIVESDYYVVQAGILLIVGSVVLMNTLVDVCYGFPTPKCGSESRGSSGCHASGPLGGPIIATTSPSQIWDLQRIIIMVPSRGDIIGRGRDSSCVQRLAITCLFITASPGITVGTTSPLPTARKPASTSPDPPRSSVPSRLSIMGDAVIPMWAMTETTP